MHKINPSLKTRVLELDLASQKAVRRAAEEVLAYEENIDVLCLNAAIMAVPLAKTVDGLESQWGTNHIGHFLFANLVMKKVLDAGKGARVINVSSFAHRRERDRFDDPNYEVSVNSKPE